MIHLLQGTRDNALALPFTRANIMLDLGSHSSQPQYQHKIPQRARYEQGKYSQRGPHLAYSRQQSPAGGIQYQRVSNIK